MKILIGIVSLLSIIIIVNGQYSPTPFPAFPTTAQYNNPQYTTPLPPAFPRYDNRYDNRYNNLNTPNRYNNPDYYGRRYAILRQDHQQDIDGSYRYSYDTENGISVAEQGQPVGRGPGGVSEVVQGQYSYTAPDGTPILVQYVADENGFQAKGAHLPTPPPIPPAIQRALAYNAAHPEEDNGDLSGRPYPYNRRL